MYNVEAYLDKCIRSILAQTYTNIEVILVDDGSTDTCASICDGYATKDDRIRVIHKPNGGLVTARKAGFSAATGEYIMSVDGDDWIEADMCEGLLRALDKSGAECAISGFIHEAEDGTEKQYQLSDKIFNLNDTIRISIIEEWLSGKGNIISPVWAKLYSADLIKRSYSDVPNYMNLGEDQVNFVNLIAIATIAVCTSDIYYHYVYRKGSYDNTFSLHEFVNFQAFACYCRDIIIKKYKAVNEKILDAWIINSCLGGLKRYFGVEDYIFLRYSYPAKNNLFGKKIVIYGAGNVGKSYYLQICRYEAIDISA